MIWQGNCSGRNNGRGVVVAPDKEIFHEAGVCSRRSCGNHNPGISDRFLCSELKRIRGWIVCR
jgi:hypothetical protein